MLLPLSLLQHDDQVSRVLQDFDENPEHRVRGRVIDEEHGVVGELLLQGIRGLSNHLYHHRECG